MSTTQFAYLGTALAKPLQLAAGKGVIVDGFIPIEQSIVDILTTPIGTRFFLREYGSRHEELLFEPNDDVLARLLRVYTLEALQAWEKRVKFIDTDVKVMVDAALINIVYKILSSNEVKSFIFPFYRRFLY